MKNVVIAIGLLGLYGTVQAQSGVTVYGVVDTSVRYSTNQNAAGSSKIEETDGMLSGSRLGFIDVEDLGAGLKAQIVLESGFAPDTGVTGQGGIMFGRQSTLALSSDFGTLIAGRKYTIAHEMMASYEAMFIANQAIVGYQGGNYTGLRQGNQIQYAKKIANISLGLGYTLGEVAGSFHQGSTKAISLAYDQGPAHIGGVYQEMNNVTTGFFGVNNPASKQKLWSAGGTYEIGCMKFYGGYTNNRLDVADYKNNVFYAGANYTITPRLNLIGTTTYDRVRHNDASGSRSMAALMLDYTLSKRTDVYIETDYSKFTGAWLTLANQPNFTTPLYGHDSRASMMVGLRHKF